MKLVKRIFTALLILLIFNLYLPNISLAGQALTKHPLETRSTPEEEIPTTKAKKTSSWTWLIVLGLVGGIAAVAAGGGGDSPPSSSPEPQPEPSGDTGDVTVTW